MERSQNCTVSNVGVIALVARCHCQFFFYRNDRRCQSFCCICWKCLLCWPDPVRRARPGQSRTNRAGPKPPPRRPSSLLSGPRTDEVSRTTTRAMGLIRMVICPGDTGMCRSDDPGRHPFNFPVWGRRYWAGRVGGGGVRYGV